MNSYKDILKNLQKKPPKKLNDKILLIDGLNTLIRSFSLIKSMNPGGSHIGGLVGFLRSLGYLVRTLEPSRVIVVWDGKGGSGNRKNIDPNYKAQRATARITHWGLYDTKEQETEALIGQLLRVREYLECLPIQEIMLDKLVPDHIIAYLAKKAANSGKEVVITSSYKDFLQLITKNISVYSPIKKILYNYSNICDEIKVLPENYNIVKALVGDTSDNLPGIKGLGLKTIIKEFPELNKNPEVGLQYIYDVCEERLGSKKIFAETIYNWKRVESNFAVMNLQEILLDSREENNILDIIKTEIPPLRVGTFLHLLSQDKIEGITKNTENWLQTFSGLGNYN